jgi:hypothetical protein
MNRQNLIILIAAAIIVVVGAVYFLGDTGTEPAPTTPATTTQPAPANQ